MSKDNLSSLYNALISKGYSADDLGDENTFRTKMSEKGNRKELYDYVSGRGDFRIGDYDSYESRLSGSVEGSVSNQVVAESGNNYNPEAGKGSDPTLNNTGRISPPSSPYVTGKGTDVRVFDVPYNDYIAMSPQQQSEVYQKAIDKKKVEENELISQSLSSQKESVNADLRNVYNEIRADEEQYRKEHPLLSFLQGFGQAQTGGRNQRTVEADPRYRNLQAASNLIDESENLLNEAKANKDSAIRNFGRGFRDMVFDVDTWTAGFSDLNNSLSLSTVLDKTEKGEELSPDEQRLLDASVINLAVNAFTSSDISTGYNVGKTSAYSIPFMLEFAVNPISRSGNTIARNLLEYGLKRFGRSSAQTAKKGALNALGRGITSDAGKFAGRFIGDTAAAAGMTATTSLPRVMSGAVERMNDNYTYDVDENGELAVKRDGNVGIGEAVGKSAASTLLENQSEMVFNAFKGMGKSLFGGINKSLPGGVQEFFNRISSSKPGQLYRELKNNPTMREIARRTQFHGLPEEYLEEVYNNFANIPLGEMSWEEATDLDNNIQTFLSLAPTSVMFGMLGLGSMASERYSNRRKLNRAFGRMNEEQKAGLKELLRKSKENGNAEIREFIKATIADESMTPEQKREQIEHAFEIAKGNAIDDIQEAETEDSIEKETEEISSLSDPSTGTYTEANRIVVNDVGEEVFVPGYIVGNIGGRPVWVAEGMENVPENRITLKPGELDESSVRSMPTQEVMSSVADMRRAQAKEQAENESKYSPDIKPPFINEMFSDGTNTYQIVRQEPDGSWLANVLNESGTPIRTIPMTDDEYYRIRQSQIDAEEQRTEGAVSGNKLLSDGRMAVQTGTDGNEVAYDVTDRNGNVVDSGSMQAAEFSSLQDYIPESNNMSEKGADNETRPEDGESKVSENPTEEAYAIPSDEKGNLLYHKVPVNVTVEALNKEELEPEEVDSFVKANKDASAKLLSGLQNKPPKMGTNIAKYKADKQAWQEKVADAQSQVDYWNLIDESIAASRVQPGDKTAEEIREMGEPLDGHELAARSLANGRLPLLYDDYKRELGFSDKEASKMFGLFKNRDNGGLTIEQAGELLMQDDLEEGTNFFDPSDANAGRNAILDVLSSARTRGDLTEFIRKNREAMAERERSAEEEHDEMQREAWAQENFGMSYSDYVTFNKVIDDIIREKAIPEEEIGEFYNTFAEELNNWNNGRVKEETEGNDRGPDSKGGESGEGVLPDEQLGDTGGVEADTPAETDVNADNEGVPSQEGTSGGNEGRVDRQGNPTDADGNLIVEDVSKISDITDEDFTAPYRTIGLPAIPQNVSEAIGTDGKRIIIKKNIFEKNRRAHSDVTPMHSREILLSALYTPDLYGQNQKAKRPYNWIVVNTKDEAGHNRIVLLEVNDNKDNVEIVHWHYTDERGVEKIRRQAKREDGQLLILPSVASEEVGALSDPTLDLPSADKDRNKLESTQISDKESSKTWQPHALPGRLMKAYESGDESLISSVEQEMRDFVNGANNMRSVYATYLRSKDLERAMEKGSPSNKTQHFIAEACKEALKRFGLPAKAMQSERARTEFAESATDSHLLDIISVDMSFDVLRAIIKNPHVSNATLEIFIKDFSNNGLDYEAQRELDKRKNEKDVFIPFADFIQQRMQERLPKEYNSLQTWKEESPEIYAEEHDSLLPEYSEYLQDLSKEGALQAIYDHSSVKQQKAIRDAFSDAELDYADYINTKIERKRKPKSSKEEVKVKKGDKASGRFFDGTVVNGIVEDVDKDGIQIRSENNGRVYHILPDNLLRDEDVRFRFIGEQGAENLDRAEEATTRLDNLSVARDMEKEFNAKKERIAKLRESKPVEITGKEYEGKYELNRDSAQKYILDNLRGEYTINDTGERVKVSKKGAKKVTSHSQGDEAHMKSIAAIPELIENAVFIEERHPYKENAQYDSFRYYVAGLKIGGEDYTVRITIGVKKGEFYYDHYLTEIEKGNLIEVAQSFRPTEDAPSPSYAENKDSILISILQTNDKENARKIKMATGWERGADGKWRYEVDDFEIDMDGLARKNRLHSNLPWGKEYDTLSNKLFDGVELTEEEISRFDELSEKVNELRRTYEESDVRYLDDYVKDEKLFEAYPELKQVRVEMYDAPTSNTGATWYSNQNLIRVNEAALERVDFRSILAHEVQHAVQSIEGFARGGNSTAYRNHLDALKEKRDAWSMIEEFDRKRKEFGEDASQTDIYNALRDEYLSDGFDFGDGFIPSRDAFDKGFNLWVRGYDKEGYEDAYNEYQYLTGKFGLGASNDRYKELSGEVEARNVQNRMDMSSEQRRATLAEETEDVAREDQIFLNDAFEEGNTLSEMVTEKNVEQGKITRAIEDLSSSLHTPVKIARTLDDVSDAAARRAIGQGRAVKAWFDPNTGEVVVYLPNATDVNDAVKSILHEVVGHKGLREMLVSKEVKGAEERRMAFDNAMMELYRQLPIEVRNEIADIAVRSYGGDVSIAMDEYLAEQAEKNEIPSWWNKVVATIRDLLRKFGIDVKLSENDVRYLLWESQRKLRNSGNPIDVARETVMRDKLGIGEHSKRAYHGGESDFTNPSLSRFSSPARKEGESVLDYADRADKAYREFLENQEALRLREVDKEDGDVPLTSPTVQAWDKLANSTKFLLRETAVDYLTAVEKFQDLISKTSGKEIKSYEDAYQSMLALSSKNKDEMDRFDSFFVKPMNRAILKLTGEKKGLKKWNWDQGPLRELVMYVEAKHGIERNRQMAVENFASEDKEKMNSLLDMWNLEKERINKQEISWKEKQFQLDEAAALIGADLKKDYSGLSSIFKDKEAYPEGWKEASENFVNQYEETHEKKDIDELWKTISNATGYALNKQYQSGLVSKEYVERQLGRFENYIPLRGFKDEIAGDVYNYIENEYYKAGNPVKSAGGRSSEAGNPFGSILNIAYSSISSGNKNIAKQDLFNLILNHGTDGLAVIDRSWRVTYDALKDYSGLIVIPENKTGENVEWVEAVPYIPEGASPEEVAGILNRFEEAMESLKKDGKAETINKKGSTAYKTLYKERNEHQIPLFVGGDKYVITITGNPRLAQAMNGLLNPEINEGALSEIGNKVQRLMAGAFTSNNIAFAVANLSKDTIYSNNQMFIRESPGYWWKFTKNQKAGFLEYPQMMVRLKKYQNGTLDVKNDTDQLFKEFMEHGGATGYTFVDTQKEYAKKLADDLNGLAKKMPQKLSAKGLFHTVFDSIEFAGQSAELVNRFAAYKTSREMGRSVKRSITDAKEVTVNFNRKGAGIKTAKGGNVPAGIALMAGFSQYGRASILFWNANMQAKYRFYKNLKEHPVKTGTTLIANSIALGAVTIPFLNNIVLPALYSVFGWDDDSDKEDYYDVLTDYERTNNICIRLPKGKGWLKIPLSPELAPWYSMGDLIGGKVNGKLDVTTADFSKNFVDAVSPLGINWEYEGPKSLLNFMPTITQPGIQNAMNVNFMGNPIAKEPISEKQKYNPKFKQVYRNTSPLLIELSKTINSIGGGDDVKASGAFTDWNPAYVQNLISGYTGGYGSVILSLADWIVDSSKNESASTIASRMPLVSRFFVSGNEEVKQRRINSSFHKVGDFVNEFEHDLKEYTKAIKESEKDKDLLRKAEYVEKLEKLINSPDSKKYQILKEVNKSVKEYDKYLKEFPDDEETQAIVYRIKMEGIEMLRK